MNMFDLDDADLELTADDVMSELDPGWGPAPAHARTEGRAR